MQRTRWSLVCAVFVAALLIQAFACATGGSTGNGTDDASIDPRMDASVTIKMDSNTSTLTDAPKMDGSITPMQDAFVPPVDAPSGPFCTANNQCTNAGECCVSINGVGFCAPGTIIAGVCFPIT